MLYLLSYGLSLFDLSATVYLTEQCGAHESNPIGRLLLTCPPAALFYKAVVVGAALWLLYRLRHNRAAVWGIRLISTVLCAVALYHAALIHMVSSTMA